MKGRQDAFGHMLLDFMQGEDVVEIIERDDGYISTSLGGPELYFADYSNWLPLEREAINFARGQVLDIGCGAGRHSLHLQNQGLTVVGIDNSPLAVEVSIKRGVKSVRNLSVTQISSKLGQFDTVLMMGNNFGLLANRDRARWLLRRLKGMTTERARIIAVTRDPYSGKNPDHLAYHDLNRTRGRMPGQVRMRVRHKKYKGQWFDYLFVSRREMGELLKGTGWKVRQIIDSDGPLYSAVIVKAT